MLLLAGIHRRPGESSMSQRSQVACLVSGATRPGCGCYNRWQNAGKILVNHFPSLREEEDAPRVRGSV